MGYGRVRLHQDASSGHNHQCFAGNLGNVGLAGLDDMHRFGAPHRWLPSIVVAALLAAVLFAVDARTGSRAQQPDNTGLERVQEVQNAAEARKAEMERLREKHKAEMVRLREERKAEKGRKEKKKKNK